MPKMQRMLLDSARDEAIVLTSQKDIETQRATSDRQAKHEGNPHSEKKVAAEAATQVYLHSLEVKAGSDLDLAGGVEEAAVVRAGNGAKGRGTGLSALEGRCAGRRSGGGQLVAEGADTVDVLMVGEIEDVGDELQVDALVDGDLLLHAEVVDDLAGVLEGVAAYVGDEGRA